MARPSGSRQPASSAPLPPRLAVSLVDASFADGEPSGDSDDGSSWSDALLTGDRPDLDRRLVLSGCRIHRSSLVGAQLDGSRLVDVVIDGADLAGVRWTDSSFTRVEFRDARLSGAQLAEARLRDVRFVGCRLDDANLRAVRGERVRFEDCRMQRVDMIGAQFDRVAWWDCDLTDAEVSTIRLTDAQLHGSTLDGLRGAQSLAPISIDDQQFTALAVHLLTAMGVVVDDRRS